MKNSNIKEINKGFDAIQFMRNQRERMSKDLKDLSPKEIIEFLKRSQAKGRVNRVGKGDSHP